MEDGLDELIGSQRVRARTEEKEFPLETMGEFSDGQGPDGRGCHGVSVFATLTG